MVDRIFYAIPIAVLVIIAFLVGFIAPDVSASRGDLSELSAQLHRLPARLEMLASTPDNNGNELPVLQTYYEVLGNLRDNYYAYTGQKVDDKELTYNAIRGMLQVLNDPYTRFLDPDSYRKMREENEGNFVGIGAHLRANKNQQIYIQEPIDGGPAEKAGVKAGDIIIKVDDKPIAGLDIDEVVTKIRGEEGTKVKLSLLRGPEQKMVEITIVRETVQFQMVESKMLEPKSQGIGYIRLRGFNEHSDQQFEKALTELERNNLKGLIPDLRENPGGLLQVAVEIGSRFIESGPVVIIEDRSGAREPLNVDKSKHNHKRYPLVVLVDKHSASASEIVAGAIQDNNKGTIVGTDTFGKARVQTVSALRDGSAIAITTAKYLTPKGRDINKVGVKPDVAIEMPELKPGEELIEFGDEKRDIQLAKAVEVMNGKLKGNVSKPGIAKETPSATKPKR
ncbi:MAG TPA: S41 family peptidase [Armatimonadota bacterium]|nr:S41 family peptidase [Armatimonadota bacterium]